MIESFEGRSLGYQPPWGAWFSTGPGGQVTNSRAYAGSKSLAPIGSDFGAQQGMSFLQDLPTNGYRASAWFYLSSGDNGGGTPDLVLASSNSASPFWTDGSGTLNAKSMSVIAYWNDDGFGDYSFGDVLFVPDFGGFGSELPGITMTPMVNLVGRLNRWYQFRVGYVNGRAYGSVVDDSGAVIGSASADVSVSRGPYSFISVTQDGGEAFVDNVDYGPLQEGRLRVLVDPGENSLYERWKFFNPVPGENSGRGVGKIHIGGGVWVAG